MLSESLNPIEIHFRKLSAAGRPPQILFSGNPITQGFHFPAKILQKSYEDFFLHPHYEPHPKGYLEARQSIAAYYLNHGWKIDPENILLTSGTSESFFYLFHFLAKPGENLLAPVPSYPLFEHVAQHANVKLKPYFLSEDNHWSIDFDSLESSIDEKTRGILLVSPHNPTGGVLNHEEIQRLAELCQKKNISVICDEVFSDFFYKQDSLPRPGATEAFPLCFTLNGISKMFALPSLKLGWIVVSGEKRRVDQAVDALETSADTFLSCHTAIQQSLPQLFSQGSEFCKNYVTEVTARKNLAVSELRKLPLLRFIEPQGGFYLFAEVLNPCNLDEEAWVIQLMEKKGIFVHPGYFFDYEQGVHFALSFLTDPQILREGIARIGEFLIERNP